MTTRSARIAPRGGAARRTSRDDGRIAPHRRALEDVRARAAGGAHQADARLERIDLRVAARPDRAGGVEPDARAEARAPVQPARVDAGRRPRRRCSSRRPADVVLGSSRSRPSRGGRGRSRCAAASSVATKSRVASRLSCQIRRARAVPYRRVSSARSSSGSCISSAVLAAVLPRPIRRRLDERDANAGVREPPRERGAGDAAADDRDVDVELARERRKANAAGGGVASQPERSVDAKARHVACSIIGGAIATGQGVTTKSLVATQPYWIDSASLPRFPKLDRDDEVDVVVVGGGITGLTAAYLLTLDGRRVAVLERERCAQIDTGHTTRAPDDGHRRAAVGAGEALRARSRAGGVGRGARGDRADRRDRRRPRARLRLRLGARLPARADGAAGRRRRPAVAARRSVARAELGFDARSSTRCRLSAGPACASTVRRGFIRASTSPASRARSPIAAG